MGKEDHIIAKTKHLLQSDEHIVDEILDDKPNLTARERRKRNRAIRKARKLFRAIDVLLSAAQNYCPYITNENSNTICCDTDIVYNEDIPDVCKLDFYRDITDNKLPAVILIHGGGFMAGDKKYRKGRSRFLAINGFAVFSINYGLAPEYAYPEPLKHIVTAANFVYDNADRFNIDPNRILVGGDSAGAYYAAMLSAFNCSDKLRAAFGCAPKFKIFGSLLNCGIYDIKTMLSAKDRLKIFDGVMLSLAGVPKSEAESYKHKDVFVPVDLVTSDFPPTFLIYSDNDIFCKGQGDIMRSRLEENGVYVEYYSARYASSNHCFALTWSSSDAAAANELLLSFALRLVNDKIKI